jgi:Ca-activated chloride channel homolog
MAFRSHYVRGFILALLLGLMGSVTALDLMPTTQRIPVRQPPTRPPLLRITDAAAQPVRLTTMNVDSKVVGHLAQTTVELTFRNPNNRILEGELQFPLLAGQQVTGFALDFDGKWRSAVPVEKAKGQEVFEEVTRTRIDPALLEATKGNNFKLRIYPIPAQGVRKVSLSITERLPAGRDGSALYRLSLPTADKMDDFSFRLRAPGLSTGQTRVLRGLTGAQWWHREDEAKLEFSRQNYKPEPRVEIALMQPSRAVTLSEEKEGKNYFYAEVQAKQMANAQRPIPARMALVWDASGSGADRDHGREFALLNAYFGAIRNTEVHLSFARDRAEDAGIFTVRNGNWSALRAVLQKVVYDGATNSAALKPVGSIDAVLLFSDGLTNYGESTKQRVDVPLLAVSSAMSADTARLRYAAEQSGGVFVDLTQTAPAAAAKALRDMPPRLLNLSADGAQDLIASPLDPATGRISIAGILSEPEANVELAWRTPSGQSSKQIVKIAKRAQSNVSKFAGNFVAQEWARLKLASLEPEYELNRAEIKRLGKAFELVTRGTSLIVLDRVDDYARYEIVPPAELRADYDRLREQARAAQEKDREAHLEQIVKNFGEKVQWWEKSFPKDEKPKSKDEEKPAGAATGDMHAPSQEPLSAGGERTSRLMSARPERMAKSARMSEVSSADRAMPASASPEETSGATAAIKLKKWSPDAPYADRLRQAETKDVYRIYLDERPAYTQSTAFFLDVADILFERKEPQLALRVLSNLAEMNLENRHILRILGYRLMQAKEPALAIPVFEQVLELAPNEPQSWRDLGLAQAENKLTQKAVNNLYEVVRRPWHGRFPDIELIALAELNAIVATAPVKPDTAAIDPRLLRNLPLDLRAVLSWDADNTDIDLWVTDPNGEKAFYGNRLTYQGGAMSRDFTGGYGPEEFSLKQAKPGKYLIQAQFYGHNQQVVSGSTTLQLRLTTGFGTVKQQDQFVTLRLKGSKEVVTVGEFEVGEAGKK